MGLILCVETSSTNCSVALASENGGYNNDVEVVHVLDLIEDQSEGYSHGERLHVFIEELLQRNGVSTSDLDAIAVSAGPGSYTGLRIGVAAVKGMCYALDVPMIAISTLESLTRQSKSLSAYIIPMLDARRMEVYSAVFKERTQVEGPAAVILDEHSYARFRESGKITFIGTGVEKFKPLLGHEEHEYIQAKPSALTLCDLAMEKFKKSDFVDVAYFEPYYLKEFKAG
ncbi:tRNA (adenosine(37)-N6)-threonylcarbamoyltransferase complex dimerization subunit type 1 TsaB [Nonlabens xiamenensis]|uniref:tRNA (adenosine(37)-N6)-threonylcarbamoyltransferase complex dimerization subunit type 1 TsaB n=1 Tax=Nonlabens xiamenensis TaxID=2341043 RepID=UPI000F60F906|nr:tRNA (adenosine(37)-N6)-threonylcarbamoyltransferase complex dimerization subunit type 1 TsaB [Nonlabens xiamenensis]